MDHVGLGRWGLRVSRLCLGTMVFGAQCDQAASRAVLDAADELGIDFLDVADVYPVPPSLETAGRTEEIVGAWLAGRRERFVVATKLVNPMGPGPNQRGGGRRWVIQACEDSLRRLRTDRIDVYYLHNSDLRAPLDETLEALDRLISAGKILYIGLSNFEAWQMGLAHAIARERRLAPVAALQPRLNLLTRRAERDLLPLAGAIGAGVMPYNPLGAGMLTGKYDRHAPPPQGSRFAWGDYGVMYQGRYWSERMFDAVDVLKQVAEEAGLTPAQAALAWILSRPAVTAPIVGASRPEQLRETAAAVERPLPAELVKRLDEATDVFA